MELRRKTKGEQSFSEIESYQGSSLHERKVQILQSKPWYVQEQDAEQTQIESIELKVRVLSLFIDTRLVFILENGAIREIYKSIVLQKIKEAADKWNQVRNSEKKPFSQYINDNNAK